MKRIALLTMLSLVMCLTMSFPASTAKVVTDTKGIYDRMNFVRQQIETRVLTSNYPDGYTYVFFYVPYYNFSMSNAANIDFIISNTPVLSIGDNYYTGSFYAGTSSLTYNTTTKYTVNNIGYGANNYTALYYSATNSMALIGCFSEQSTVKIAGRLTDYKLTGSYAGQDWYITFTPTITALQALISQSKAKQDTGYTQSSWQALQLQITAAENLLLTTGYTQEHVNNKVALLQAALDGLTLLPDTSELDTLLLEADAIENIGYTSETWARFVASRISARSLVSSADYTQSELDYIMSELMAAINGLTLNAVKPPEPPTKPPAPLGYDVGSGDISGYFAPVPKVFYVYIVSVFPVVVGLFSIILSIKLLPRLGSLILKNLRR